jgi:hypothetical protein
MRPFLLLLQRLEGLPVDQMNQYLAQGLADELGLDQKEVCRGGGMDGAVCGARRAHGCACVSAALSRPLLTGTRPRA